LANPKIGLSMLYMLGRPFERMVEEIPKTKTKYIEVVDDGWHSLDKKRAAKLRSVGEAHDIKFAVHAPFSGINISLQPGYLLNAMLKRLKGSIVNSAALDCKIWVFHPGLRSGVSDFYPGEDWIRNLGSVRTLYKFAGEHGVKVAIENIMTPFVLKSVDDFKRFYAEIGLDVGFALDTGHANLSGEVDGFLKAFPSKLAHVHAHDNLGKMDQHLGIGYGNIDWESFGELFKKTGFNGIVIVESVEHIEESMEKLKHLLL
jgi:sugar phosphate isomerase/epimerase